MNVNAVQLKCDATSSTVMALDSPYVFSVDRSSSTSLSQEHDLSFTAEEISDGGGDPFCFWFFCQSVIVEWLRSYWRDAAVLCEGKHQQWAHIFAVQTSSIRKWAVTMVLSPLSRCGVHICNSWCGCIRRPQWRWHRLTCSTGNLDCGCVAIQHCRTQHYQGAKKDEWL